MRAYERYFIVCLTAASIIGNVMGQYYNDNNDNNQYADFAQQHENIRRRPDQISSDFYPTNDESDGKTLYDDENDPKTDFETSDDKYRLRRHPTTDGVVHRSLCKMEIRTILLNDDPDWEFFPERYTERKCQIQYDQRRRTNQNHKHQNHTCGGIGSECVSRNQTLYFIKRRKGTVGRDCWESHVINEVPYSCDCMWPEHIKGSIQVPIKYDRQSKNFLHRQ